MFLFSLLILIGIHNGSGLIGWVWLFLGAGVWYFWYYAGRRGFGAAVTGVIAMLIAFFRMVASIFSSCGVTGGKEALKVTAVYDNEKPQEGEKDG